MEAIVTVVGFLGAGKTTLLKYLINNFIKNGWDPYIILNDYENAYMDAQQFTEQIKLKSIKALSGSCICCSGIVELRDMVNRIPQRKNGITLIEANGTSDACSLMEFLGVGLEERFLPPVQVSVVDVNNWQKREEHNALESSQIQVSSLLVLTHLEKTTPSRVNLVIKDLEKLNPTAKIATINNLDITLLPELLPSKNSKQQFDHLKSHWASCSVDLPNLPNINSIHNICQNIPKTILRVKGCVKIEEDENYTYFERKPDGEVYIREFNGVPITGTKLLIIGPGSNTSMLHKVIKASLTKQQ